MFGNYKPAYGKYITVTLPSYYYVASLLKLLSFPEVKYRKGGPELSTVRHTTDHSNINRHIRGLINTVPQRTKVNSKLAMRRLVRQNQLLVTSRRRTFRRRANGTLFTNHRAFNGLFSSPNFAVLVLTTITVNNVGSRTVLTKTKHLKYLRVLRHLARKYNVVIQAVTKTTRRRVTIQITFNLNKGRATVGVSK